MPRDADRRFGQPHHGHGLLERARQIILPDGNPLLDYQVTGIVRTLAGTAPIAAEAIGSGKTWRAIMGFVLWREDHPGVRLVVTCPKSVVEQWLTFLEAVGLRAWALRTGKHDIPEDLDAVVVPATTTLINCQERLRDWLSDGMLVLDEAHLFKAPNAKRTQAVYGKKLDRKGGLADWPRIVLAMSGTFTPNHNGEMFPHLRALAPETIQHNGRPMLLSAFELQYCTMKPVGPQRIMRPYGSTNTEELKARIASRVTIVTSDQVQAAFPKPRREVIPIDAADVNFDFLASVEKIPDPELRARALDIHKRLKRGAGPKEIDALVEELLRLAGEDRHLAHIRRAIGRAKIQWLEEFMEGKDRARPALIFNTYIDTGDEASARLRALGIPTVRIYGGTSARDRASAIAAIQERGAAAALLQVDAAGAGLNFQAADTIIMLEPSWSPGTNEQAVGRACRIGQDTSVRILWPVIKGTIDEAVLRILQSKSKNTKVLWS